MDTSAATSQPYLFQMIGNIDGHMRHRQAAARAKERRRFSRKFERKILKPIFGLIHSSGT